jgi:hypothetical protein
MPLPTKEAIIHSLEKEGNHSILELTASQIKQEKNDILQKLQLPRDKLKTLHTSLKKYRFISDIKDIIIGNYIRWINITNYENLTLTNGAYVIDFKETPETIYIICRTTHNHFFNVDINKCILFQKLNIHEETLLAVINYLDK